MKKQMTKALYGAATAAFLTLPVYSQNATNKIEFARGPVLDSLKEAQREKAPELKQEKKTGMTLYLFTETQFLDSYNSPQGFKILEGPANHTLIVGGLENVIKEGDNLSAFTWMDTELKLIPKREALVEQDFGVSYDFPVFTYGKDRQNRVTLNFSGQYWKYWGGQLGEHDYVVNTGVTWNGPVDVGVCNRHFFAHKGVEEGNAVIASVSKAIPLTRGSESGKKWQFVYRPCANVAYLDNFFIPESGFSAAQIINRLEVSRETLKKNIVTIFAGAGYQFNLDGNMELIPDKPIWYIGGNVYIK